MLFCPKIPKNVSHMFSIIYSLTFLFGYHDASSIVFVSYKENLQEKNISISRDVNVTAFVLILGFISLGHDSFTFY